MLGFYYLIYLHIDAYLSVISSALHQRLGPTFSAIWLTVGFVLGYNVCFNYTFACVVKANGPLDLKEIEKLRLLYKNRQSRKEADLDRSDRYDGVSADMKQTLRYRTRSLDNLEQCWQRYCSQCKLIKPARTHHCRVCKRCVFMMDHHCPWVNNCLGMENYRYFLLFIFYLLIGSSWYALSIVSIWNHSAYVSLPSL